MSATDHEQHLRIYLQDHHAAGRAGKRLAARIARGISPEIEGHEQLRHVADEIAEDLETLEKVMHALRARPSVAKDTLSVIFESLGRLKPNGRLRERSPLSDVEELETLLVGITGKAALWASLGPRTASVGVESAALIERARAQAETVSACRDRASARAFATGERDVPARPHQRAVGSQQ
jgi:hypothetical protein